jgi:hypothetical protein
MKVTNLTNSTIYLKDLGLIRQGQTEARRAENQYIGAGLSVYLPDTSDVVRSAQKGDLHQFEQVGKLRLNETLSLAAFPGPGNSATIHHGLGYYPHATALKKVVTGAIVTWVTSAGTVDITHNDTFTETTFTNTVALPLEFLVRIG